MCVCVYGGGGGGGGGVCVRACVHAWGSYSAVERALVRETG